MDQDVVMLVLSYVTIHVKIKILYIGLLLVIFVMPQKHKLKLEMKQLVTLGVQMMYNMEKDVVKLVLKNVTTHVLIQIIYIIPL
jgi:hypothetical protein